MGLDKKHFCLSRVSQNTHKTLTKYLEDGEANFKSVDGTHLCPIVTLPQPHRKNNEKSPPGQKSGHLLFANEWVTLGVAKEPRSFSEGKEVFQTRTKTNHS